MKRLFRLWCIQRVLFKHGLLFWLGSSFLLRFFQNLFFLLPGNLLSRKRQSPAKSIREALEELGPIYVKIGQLLSTRRDLLDVEIIAELSRLQDRVPPFPGEQARQLIEKDIACSLPEVTTEFHLQPLASGSIAQVHFARLQDDRAYVFKVIRPGIRARICEDLELIYFIVQQMEKYYTRGRIMHLTGVVQELEHTLLSELDMRREAANASQLRRNFQDEKNYYVPEVNWDLTHDNVLVMEYVGGIPMNDIAAIRNAGIDTHWLAEFVMKVFFTQVFRDNYFHADMHPGNIFIQPETATTPLRVAVVDFGVMSSLTESDQRYLAENFLAFLNRDYHRVARLHWESGWVPRETRLDALEFDIRTVCEPLLDKPVSQISFAEVLRSLFNIARRFNVEIMPQLLLLQKTLISLEGITRQMHPEMNLWEVARPQLEEWIQRRSGFKWLFRETLDNFSRWGDRLPQLPFRVLEIVDQIRDGSLRMRFRSDEVRGIRADLERHYRHILRVILYCVLLICAVLFYVFT